MYDQQGPSPEIDEIAANAERLTDRCMNQTCAGLRRHVVLMQ
jgi:hypothetical protein